MDTQNKTVSAGFYLFAGTVVGTALGLLFAPKKGSELRADVGEFGNRARKKGQQLYARAKKGIPAGISAAVGAVQKTGHQVMREAKPGAGQMFPGRTRRTHRGRGRPAEGTSGARG